MKKASVLILLLIAAAVAWLWLTPSRAVEGLRAAARAGDAEQLSRYVDFPVLRENLKTEIKASVIGDRKADPENPLSGLGAALGGAMINGLVDTFVSPEAIAAVARGYRPDTGSSRDQERSYTIKRRRLNSFQVVFDDTARDAPKLVFSRRGLRWQLTNIQSNRLRPSK